MRLDSTRPSSATSPPSKLPTLLHSHPSDRSQGTSSPDLRLDAHAWLVSRKLLGIVPVTNRTPLKPPHFPICALHREKDEIDGMETVSDLEKKSSFRSRSSTKPKQEDNWGDVAVQLEMAAVNPIHEQVL